MLPDYTIRESARAKHVRFRVTLADGLIVVIPVGFDSARIPALLEEKRAWLMRALSEMEKRRESLPSPNLHPQEIALSSVGQIWRLDWIATDAANISIQETDAFQLQVSGPIRDPAAWQEALKRWLIERAQDVLIPWTQDLSQELGIPIQRVVIRCQKTRWGSCSANDNINLNVNLVRLRPGLMDYVILHELVHTRTKNHSRRFWSQLDELVGDAKALDKELKKHVLGHAV